MLRRRSRHSFREDSVSESQFWRDTARRSSTGFNSGAWEGEWTRRMLSGTSSLPVVCRHPARSRSRTAGFLGSQARASATVVCDDVGVGIGSARAAPTPGGADGCARTDRRCHVTPVGGLPWPRPAPGPLPNPAVSSAENAGLHLNQISRTGVVFCSLTDGLQYTREVFERSTIRSS